MDKIINLFSFQNYEAIDYVFLVVEIVLFLIVIGVIIRILRLYFESIKLRDNSEKNVEKITKNKEMINLTIKNFVKIGGIVFAVLLILKIAVGIWKSSI